MFKALRAKDFHVLLSDSFFAEPGSISSVNRLLRHTLVLKEQLAARRVQLHVLLKSNPTAPLSDTTMLNSSSKAGLIIPTFIFVKW